MKNVYKRFLALIPVCVIGLAGCQLNDPKTERDFAVFVITQSSPLREKISHALTEGGRVSLAEQILESGTSASETINFSLMDSSGTIIAFNKQYGIVISLVPVITNGVVSWKCFGHPKSALPAACS